MAFVLPIFLFLVFGTIDFGRAIYTLNTISSLSRSAARAMAVAPELNSDCLANQQLPKSGNGIAVVRDPHSLYGNVQGISTPTASVPGYLYLDRAMGYVDSQGIYQCRQPTITGDTRFNEDTKATVVYLFRPLTPLVNHLVPSITLTAISVNHTETP